MSNDTPNTDESRPAELLTHPSYEELAKKLDETEQKVNEYWERILRMQAESENAARRTKRDVGEAHQFAIKKFVSELVPIIDSLELSINNVPGDKAAAAECILEGVKLTLKMFYSAMEKFGIKQIDPVGQPFDPACQQAISMQADPSVEPGSVISVLQKGYTLNDRLIRPALVVVAKGAEE